MLEMLAWHEVSTLTSNTASRKLMRTRGVVKPFKMPFFTAATVMLELIPIQTRMMVHMHYQLQQLLRVIPPPLMLSPQSLIPHLIASLHWLQWGFPLQPPSRTSSVEIIEHVDSPEIQRSHYRTHSPFLPPDTDFSPEELEEAAIMQKKLEKAIPVKRLIIKSESSATKMKYSKADVNDSKLSE
jgi:hypothetical protein